MRRRSVLSSAVGALLLAPALAGGLGGSVPAAAVTPTGHQRAAFPDVIALPDGFAPEGISAGGGTRFYVGSLAGGAIYRGDVRTGRGGILVPAVPGRVAVGTEVHGNRLWVAGGPQGTARVYNATTGRLVRLFRFAPADTSFVNDVVVTRRAAYFTDSVNPVLYKVPIRDGGRLGKARSLPLTGDLVYEAGFNANGIEASRDGRRLVVVQSNTGKLFRVLARTGVARQVRLGPVGRASLTNGDGMLREGRRLYVVRNSLSRIAVVRLGDGYRTGTVTRTLTDPDLDVPATVALVGDRLYAVNARFSTPPTPDTTYTVVRVGP